MASQADIVGQMTAALAASAPDLDTSVGSVTRKILDAMAASVAGASLDSQMLAYQYDINSMTGAALDAFVQLFGMSRYPAARATGTVTFTRGTATDVVTIPVSSQVATSDGSIVVQTLTAGILEPAALSVTVPVQSVLSGPSGNVPAGSLTQLMTPVSEVTAVTNVSALTGGANQETDTQLQARFKATVFKNMAGTSQMFLGIALNDPDCTAANVVDGATRRREQLQVASGQAVSTVADAQYTYPSGQVVGRNIDAGDVAAPGIQYTWDYTANPPSVQVIDSAYFPAGELIDVSFLYMDKASRNSPAAGIYNRVDIWCAGQRAQSAAATIKYSNTVTFQSSPTSNWYAGSFVRPDGSSPEIGNTFMPLPYGPIITVPPVLVVNGVTYGLASLANPMGSTAGGVSYSYQIVHRSGAYGWSPYSDFGLEWEDSPAPPNGVAVVISEDYTFNDVPSAIQTVLENWRLAGTDVLAHQGVQAFLQFSLAIIYDPTISQSVTQAAISSALSAYLSTLGFNSRLYPSSVLQIVENTPGVIASRFLTGADYPGYNPAAPDNYSTGIQAVYGGVVTASYVDAGGNPTDVEFGDDTLPVFGGTVLVTKAPNTMGSFA
jgi:uncharacterized phage protein gp47/JayE